MILQILSATGNTKEPVFPVAAEKICKDIRHAVKPFVGGVGLGVCLSSPAPTAGRAGAQRLSRRRVDFGDWDVPKSFTR